VCVKVYTFPKLSVADVQDPLPSLAKAESGEIELALGVAAANATEKVEKSSRPARHESAIRDGL